MTYLRKWEILTSTQTLSTYFLVEVNTSKILFLYAINVKNKLDLNICSSSCYNIFRNALLKFIGPSERRFFNNNDLFRIKCWQG